MPRKVKPLSELEIKKAKFKGKESVLYDGDGLQLTIRENSKFFEFRYKSPVNGKVKKITIGHYPVLSLTEARDKRMEYQKVLQAGLDPNVSYTTKGVLFADIASDYLETIQNQAPNTIKRVTGMVERDLVANLGGMPMDKITRFDVIKVIKQIEKRGSLFSARRTLLIANKLWRYGLTLGAVEHNIINDIDASILTKHEPKNFSHTTDIKKLKEILGRIPTANIELNTKLALLFTAHTFLRAFNVRYLEWSEVDLDARLISIPSEKMKMRKPHLVPLTEQTIDILNTAKKYNNGQYVFSTMSGKIMSDATLNRALERMGYKGVQTTHGFRHTASTLLHENIPSHGVHSLAIERQLAHVDSSIRGVYNKAEYLQERIKLMEWWSGFISG